MATEENPHAGHGAVVLDIGGDVGALIVVMPADMEDLEVEIIPTGTDARPPHQLADDNGSEDGRYAGAHNHDHDHDHAHDDDGHTHTHDHDGHTHTHVHDAGDDNVHGSGAAAAPPHVAVVARPTPNGTVVHSLVYGSLPQGTYDLYVRPFGRIHLTATVLGGQVTETHWV